MTLQPRATRAPEPWSEAQFTAEVVVLAKMFGWRRYHTYRSRNSAAGFPDEVLVKPPRVIFAELKRKGGKPTPAQVEWLEELRLCPGVETYLWTEDDLEEIASVLSGRPVA